MFIQQQPSLGRVAVVAFYLDRYGQSEDMYRQSDWHTRHPLSEGRLRATNRQLFPYVIPLMLKIAENRCSVKKELDKADFYGMIVKEYHISP